MAAGGSGIFKRSTGLNGIQLGLNPFIPEFIIHAKPLNPEIKWRRLEKIQSWLVTQLLVPYLIRKGSSEDS